MNTSANGPKITDPALRLLLMELRRGLLGFCNMIERLCKD